MRLLTAILVVLSGLWGGYWYVASSVLESELRTYLETAESNGVSVQYSGLRVQGFPNRFDTTVDTVDLTHVASGIRWRAPFFQAFALSYKPYHLVAVWPHEQRIDFPEGGVTIRSEDLRASLVVEPNKSLALDRFRLDATAPVILFDGWEEAAAERLFIATQQAEGPEFSHDVALSLSRASLPRRIMALVDPAGTRSDLIDALEIDATVTLDAKIARDTMPTLEHVMIREAVLRWDHLSLGVSGALRVDHLGFASGTLTLRARNWRDVFQMLAGAGLLDPIWEGAIAPLAAADGDPDNLETDLTLRDGLFYFGPLALGPAPRLR